MPRVLVTHHHLCTISQRDIEAELTKYYQPGDFQIVDALELSEKMGIARTTKDDETLLVCLAEESRDANEASIGIMCTRVVTGDGPGQQENMLVVNVVKKRVIIFSLPDNGGGTMQNAAHGTLFALPKKKTLATVFGIIKSQDQQNWN